MGFETSSKKSLNRCTLIIKQSLWDLKLVFLILVILLVQHNKAVPMGFETTLDLYRLLEVLS